MTVKQFSVFLENKKGSLAELLQLLSRYKVELRALSIADTMDFGVLRFITSNNEATRKALKDDERIFSENEVIAALMTDEPGGLASVLQYLSDRDVNVEYIYAFVVKSGESACVIIRANDNELAQQALTERGIRLLSQAEIDTF